MGEGSTNYEAMSTALYLREGLFAECLLLGMLFAEYLFLSVCF